MVEKQACSHINVCASWNTYSVFLRFYDVLTLFSGNKKTSNRMKITTTEVTRSKDISHLSRSFSLQGKLAAGLKTDHLPPYMVEFLTMLVILGLFKTAAVVCVGWCFLHVASVLHIGSHKSSYGGLQGTVGKISF